MIIQISIDKQWAGFYFFKGFTIRLGLGFVAVTFIPMTEEELYDL